MEFYQTDVQPGKMCDTIIKQRVIHSFSQKNICVFISHTKLCKQDWWTLFSLPYGWRFFVKEHQEACGFCPLLWLIIFLLFSQRAFHNKENLFTKVTRRRHRMCLTNILPSSISSTQRIYRKGLISKGVGVNIILRIKVTLFSAGAKCSKWNILCFQVKRSCTKDLELNVANLIISNLRNLITEV